MLSKTKCIKLIDKLLKHYQHHQILFVICITENKFSLKECNKYHDMQLCYNYKSKLLDDVQFIKRNFSDIQVIHYVGLDNKKPYKYDYVYNHTIFHSNSSFSNNKT